MKPAVGPSRVEDARRAAAEAHALGGRRPLDVDVHPRRQRVDDRQADAVQTARGDVRAATELAAGVQLGRHHLDAGQPGLGLLVGGDAAAVVVDLGRPVGVQGHLHGVRGAGERLVDPVVDDLPQALHETAGVGGADVHARALAHRLESLEDEEVSGVVGVVGDRRAPAVERWCCCGLRVQPTRGHRRHRAATPVRTVSRHAGTWTRVCASSCNTTGLPWRASRRENDQAANPRIQARIAHQRSRLPGGGNTHPRMAVPTNEK